MGWKSTITISRDTAVRLIIENVNKLSNEELESALSDLGYGDKVELPYFGHNFDIVNETKN